ncbi:MAG: hypothetical protein NTW29_20675 [Bacteroidetes bacterium]|nr:hypothetical protein [Bacteroidota bacterium]
MTDQPKYEFLRQFEDDNELMTALQTGSLDDKRHALLNISYSDGNGEVVFDLFLNYINDPELKFTSYLCIDNFLETCRSYPLMKILPSIIAGLDNEEQFIRGHCQSALENLVRPGKITDEDLSFNSFQIKFDNALVSEYLNSLENEKIIVGLLYIFYQPHKDEELFEILNQQLIKKIKSVTCIIGQIIDTKLWSIIEQISGLEEISLASYKSAIEIGIGGKATWVYDRFDEMQELASQHMKTLKPDTDDQNGG